MGGVSRRSVVLGMASIAGVTGLTPTTAQSQNNSLRIRENITAFARDEKKVASLRAAIALMKRRSAAQPTAPNGWLYWASVHGTDGTPPPELRTLYNQCHHSDDRPAGHFLSWHRAYLHFFEQVLAEASIEATGAAIALPYWDWYTQPEVPEIFTEGSAETNPLWHRRGNVRLTSGGLLVSAFQQQNLLAGRRSRGFSFLVEMNPHNRVHGLIGADMGDPEVASRDPIFFLHHANVDRLWSIWSQNAGVQGMPSSASAWARQSFRFSRDSTWTIVADRLRRPAETLGYRYDNETLPRVETSMTDTNRDRSKRMPFDEAEEADLDIPQRSNESLDLDEHHRHVADALSPQDSAEVLPAASGVMIGSSPVTVKMGDLRKLSSRAETKPKANLEHWVVMADVDVGSLEGTSVTVSARVKTAQGADELVFIMELNSFTAKVAARHEKSGQDQSRSTDATTVTVRASIDHVLAVASGDTRSETPWELVLDPGTDRSALGATRTVSIGSVRIEER